jgi:hypothetical protein
MFKTLAIITAAAICSLGSVALAQTTTVIPTPGGGYSIYTPGRGTSTVTPTPGGGYSIYSPGQGTSTATPTPGGGYTIHTPRATSEYGR